MMLALLLMVLLALPLAACSGGDEKPASAQAVEAYLAALTAKDADRLSTLSCAEWEESAILELDSFQAVETRLDNVACSETENTGAEATVTCSGNLVATYNEEDQNFALDARPYRVVEQGGEWLVCGYR
jgi:hypothetical protein